MSDWPQLRALIRRYLLIGDVALHDSSYDVPMTKNGSGVDSEARAALWSLQEGLRRLEAQDKVAAALIQRDIGKPCELKVHKDAPGHCHRLPLREVAELWRYEIEMHGKGWRERQSSWGELERQTKQAVGLLMRAIGD